MCTVFAQVPDDMTKTRHLSLLPPLRELSPQKDGPLHVGWQQLRAALRGASIAPGLLARSLHPRLGPAARLLPTPKAIVDLLDGYFGSEARGQHDEGRFLVIREDGGLSARKIVARLRQLVPELGPLTLVEETRRNGTTLVIRTTGAFIEVEPLDVDREMIAPGWTRRVVTVDALVVAANKLLKFYGEPIRFLPVASEDGVNAYLAVDRDGAEVLDSIYFWGEDLDDLDNFAQWRRESSVVRTRTALGFEEAPTTEHEIEVDVEVDVA